MCSKNNKLVLLISTNFLETFNWYFLTSRQDFTDIENSKNIPKDHCFFLFSCTHPFLSALAKHPEAPAEVELSCISASDPPPPPLHTGL